MHDKFGVVEYVRQCIIIYEQTLRGMGLLAPKTRNQTVDNSRLTYTNPLEIESQYASAPEYCNSMLSQRSVYLIEWRMRKSHWSEIGLGVWEADHNSEIWFTEAGANAMMNERLEDPHFRDLYEMRVTEYIPTR